jgi:flagellar biosynthesis/type III secretory pathway protein FliH
MMTEKLNFRPIRDVVKSGRIERITGNIDMFFPHQAKSDKPQITQEDLEKVKKASYEQGYNQSQSEIDEYQRELSVKVNSILEDLNSKLLEVEANAKITKHQNIADLVAIAIEVAKKISLDTVDEDKKKILEKSLIKALNLLSQQPHIDISVNPSMVPFIEPLLEELANRPNFTSEIKILADKNLTEVDCKVAWQDGVIETSREIVVQKIKEILGINEINVEKE